MNTPPLYILMYKFYTLIVNCVKYLDTSFYFNICNLLMINQIFGWHSICITLIYNHHVGVAKKNPLQLRANDHNYIIYLQTKKGGQQQR